jgi:hypothetical protein
LFSLLFKFSGLPDLAAEYPFQGGNKPGGELLTKQTVKVGPVRYRRCVNVSISPLGLYLAVLPPIGKQATVLIPWAAITSSQVSTLYSRKAVKLFVGQGNRKNITVYFELYKSMQSYLLPEVYNSK